MITDKPRDPIDNLLDLVLKPRTVTVVAGKPGEGKSSFAAWLLAVAGERRGVRGFFGSLDNTHETVASIAKRQGGTFLIGSGGGAQSLVEIAIREKVGVFVLDGWHALKGGSVDLAAVKAAVMAVDHECSAIVTVPVVSGHSPWCKRSSHVVNAMLRVAGNSVEHVVAVEKSRGTREGERFHFTVAADGRWEYKIA